MKILIAMRSVQQAEGGPITAAFGLAQALMRRGHNVVIAAHDDGLDHAALRAEHPDEVDVRLFPLSRRLWEHSREYTAWLHSEVVKFDVVVINSLWISHVHHAVAACKKSGVPYVIRPHGCLTKSDMAHHRLRKRIYWAVEERRNCQDAEFIHCTAAPEAEDCRDMGLKNVEVIPLGVDEDLFGLDVTDQRERNRIVFVGRIAEKKGIDILIRALATPQAREVGLKLDVLGVDHRGLQAGLEALAASLGVADRVRFRGHANASMRRDYLRAAGQFALASKDENFGIAVAEAMAAGLPVVITPYVSHEAIVREREAGFVVERSVEAFSDAMTRMARLPEPAFASMGKRARALVRESYSWDLTAEKLEQSVAR